MKTITFLDMPEAHSMDTFRAEKPDIGWSVHNWEEWLIATHGYCREMLIGRIGNSGSKIHLIDCVIREAKLTERQRLTYSGCKNSTRLWLSYATAYCGSRKHTAGGGRSGIAIVGRREDMADVIAKHPDDLCRKCGGWEGGE